MSDVQCPHCGKRQNINHDNGYGYEEDERYTQCCPCGKEFGFSTNISYDYSVFCENGNHTMEQSEPPHEFYWICENCDHDEVKR